jgi:hypothetical protein
MKKSKSCVVRVEALNLESAERQLSGAIRGLDRDQLRRVSGGVPIKK